MSDPKSIKSTYQADSIISLFKRTEKRAFEKKKKYQEMSATLVSELHLTTTVQELNSSQKSAPPIKLIYQTTFLWHNKTRLEADKVVS